MNMRTPALSGQPIPAHRRVPRGFGPISELVTVWMERRRSRRHLAQLDDRLLRDIGLSPREAQQEAAMPFWKS